MGGQTELGLEPRRRDELAGALSTAFESVIAGVNALADDDASHFARDTNKDPILAALQSILRLPGRATHSVRMTTRKRLRKRSVELRRKTSGP